MTPAEQHEFAAKQKALRKTRGWPASELMQDDSRELSKWLSEKPGAKLHAKEAAQSLVRPLTSADVVDAHTVLTTDVRLGGPKAHGAMDAVLGHAPKPSDRHKPGYMAEYMRAYRAAKKAGLR